MKIIPDVKDVHYALGNIIVEEIKWIFSDGTDKRLVKAAAKIMENSESGIPVHINSGNEKSEAYTLKIEKDKITVSSDGAQGAFYGIKTLAALLRENGGTLECCEINDSPDMEYRGFYHDITRGKVPKLETLKKLVDTMSDYKLNSLQLYVEHAYEFKEYEEVRSLGYMTKDEVLALDEYCRENFIELVPSLSTFGHLYHLLSIDKYKHLCELENYTPTMHHYMERMGHHTINPLKDESFELIKSLIDQYLPLFKSDKFNICCDETFDLCKGVNRGKDPAKLYCGFVKKIAEYVMSKGKTVMMWGDIILQHPEYIDELPDGIIFLNWDYSDEPNREKVKKFSDSGKAQIVCPGTSTWNQAGEQITCEELNISRLTGYGYEFGAKGILNTNWGDYGNIASLECAMYGLICGAAVGWRKETVFDKEFRKLASQTLYGDSETGDLIDTTCGRRGQPDWCNTMKANANLQLNGSAGTPDMADPACIDDVIDTCKSVRDALCKKPIKEEIKEELIISLDFKALIAKWYAAVFGIKADCYVNFGEWVKKYEKKWLEKNKRSELDSLLELFNYFEDI